MAKSKKVGFLHDAFEQLGEFGKSTAKNTVRQVADTFNPLSGLTESSGSDKNRFSEAVKKIEQGKSKSKNNTPLDFDKLNQKYQNQDKQKADALRNRLFQRVKDSDEKLLYQKKQQEQEKKRQEAYQLEQDKRRKLQQQHQQQSGNIPHGKERRSIFAPNKKKKMVQAESPEMRVSAGK